MSDFYILVREYYLPWPHHRQRSRTVYVKEGNFFIEQGGLKEEWGKNWINVQAESIDHARHIGQTMEIGDGG